MRTAPAWLVACLLCAGGGAGAQTPHVALDVTLDPATRELRARATLLVAPPVFRFVLADPLTVARATLAGGPAPARAVDAGDGARAWEIAIPAAGELSIDYGGVLAPLDAGLDHRRVMHDLPPMVAAGGSYLQAGSLWHPAPAARYTYAVTLSLPPGQRGLAPGTLVDERTLADGGYRARFEFPQPAEGIDLMTGPYSVRERLIAADDGRTLRLRTYFMPGQEGLADAYLDDSARLIATYSKRIGPYPFAGFSMVASPLPTGFGMPGATYIAAAILALPFVRATSLGHEIVHNWWGNGVLVDYARGNWAEGLTTFMADHAFRAQDSPAAARQLRVGWLRDFAALDPAQRMALVEFRARTHGAAAAIGYGKAAMLFVMLHDLIGADAFERGVRAFWQSHRFRVAGWDDLRAAFAQACGCPLAAFFAQWLERDDLARPRIVAARADEARSELVLTLEQPAPPLTLALPLALDAGDSTDMRVVTLAGTRDTVRLPYTVRPQSVRLDPDARTWRALASQEQPPILRQWFLARSPALALTGAEADLRAAADTVAGRAFEVAPRHIDAAAALADAGPVLLVGRHADIDAALARLGVGARPLAVGGAGTAQVWTLPDGPARGRLAIVSVQDAAALAALARPLPHYGATSHLVFDGARMVAGGTWPGDSPAYPVERAPAPPRQPP